jgi:putative flippase GtrA
MSNFNTIKNKFLNRFGQFIKYGLVGAINTLITAVVLFVLQNVFGVSYKISNASGYIAGFFNSFAMNRRWTFKASQRSTIKQFFRFTAVFGISYLIQLGLVVIFIDLLSMNKNMAQLLGMVFYTLISYISNKLFTFKD